jgi:hypothetical protein
MGSNNTAKRVGYKIEYNTYTVSGNLKGQATCMLARLQMESESILKCGYVRLRRGGRTGQCIHVLATEYRGLVVGGGRPEGLGWDFAAEGAHCGQGVVIRIPL